MNARVHSVYERPTQSDAATWLSLLTGPKAADTNRLLSAFVGLCNVYECIPPTYFVFIRKQGCAHSPLQSNCNSSELGAETPGRRNPDFALIVPTLSIIAYLRTTGCFVSQSSMAYKAPVCSVEMGTVILATTKKPATPHHNTIDQTRQT